MGRSALLAWSPLAAAGTLAYALQFGAMETGLLLGAAAFGGLGVARRPMPLPFAAWTLAAAAALGFTAGVFAGLVGLSVRAMMAEGAQHWVGSTLAVVAVALATLGVLVAIVAMLGRRAGGDG
ncbi:MAG: hypothetical protein N3D71_03875 [Burkholderiaceae bacterium]|nr:hypothetical protein [Burkholderiaceae bacterium]